MYPQFFGFQKLPFRLRPDPDFLYPGQEYRRARSSVLGALRGKARVVLVMGQPGVGKTLLLDDVLQEIAGQFSPCRINQPHISATELLQALNMQLGTEPIDAEANNAKLFNNLISSLDAQGVRESPPLLIVDDAQLLAGATLVTLGDIMARAPRLKVLLVGQNDREKRGGLNARIVREQEPQQVMMPPLGAEGAKAYIEHRLRVAGSAGKELFTADAYGMIFQQTGGAARLINVLCDAALHAACLRASGHVSSAEVLAATQDSRWPEALARARARPLPVEFPEGPETAPAAAAVPVPAARPAAAAVAAPPAAAGPALPAAVPDVAGLASAPVAPVTSAAQVAASAQVAAAGNVAAAAKVAAAPPAGAVAMPAAPAMDPPSFTDTSTQVDTGAAARVASGIAQLLLSNGREHIATCSLEPGRISIGRASDNLVRLDAPIVSRHHCQIVTIGTVSTVEDLGSVNGISVNGKLVKKHILEHADQIMVGDYVLTYVSP